MRIIAGTQTPSIPNRPRRDGATLALLRALLRALADGRQQHAALYWRSLVRALAGGRP